MSNNNANTNKTRNTQQLANAIKVVKAEIATLGQKIRAAAPEDRPALEKEMAELMSSVGMTYVESDVVDQAPLSGEEQEGGVGHVLLDSMTKIADNLTSTLPAADETGTPDETPELSLWQRFTLFRQANPKKFWSGFAMVVGVAAGMGVYFARAKNTAAAVSSVSGAVEIAPDQLPTATSDAPTTTIFTKIGDVVIAAASAVKGYAVAAYAWVKNLFVKTAEVVNESTPEVVPTAA